MGTDGHRQRLRQRFLDGGISSNDETTLLELLLTYALPQKDVLPIAKNFLKTFGSLKKVFAAPLDKLTEIPGIKENSAILIKLIHQFLKNPKTQNEIERKLGNENEFLKQPVLFKDAEVKTQNKEKPVRTASYKTNDDKKIFFGKSMLKEAIDMLPKLPGTDSIQEIKRFLLDHLHFNSAQTRMRTSRYIISRMFPGDIVDRSLMKFAKNFPSTSDLKDICFYQFSKVEPLMIKVIRELLIPNINVGRISRQGIREYLKELNPNSNYFIDCGKAVSDTLVAGGIAKATRDAITFSYREIPLNSFAFILHSEFPTPAVYSFSEMETNRFISNMMWKPERIIPALYDLRNKKILSKVSDIDNIRQFTTKWHLGQVVDYLIDALRNQDEYHRNN